MSAPAANLVRVLGAGVAVMAVAAALTFTVDPLQIFRPARFTPPMYSNDSRLQNAGLIHSQDFDTAFMGTSLAIHFRQSDLDRSLGVRSLKLAMPGSNSREQNFVLAAALQRGPKRIIWEMDDWIFRDAPDIDATTYFPADLYRRNLRGLSSYLFSGAMAREALWMLAREAAPLRPALAGFGSAGLLKFAVARVDDINCLAPDFDVPGDYNAGRARAAFARITDPAHRAYLSEGYDYGAMVRNFERDAVGLIQSHPDVTFDVYFPPYSILQFVAMREAAPATLKIVYDFTGTISRRLADFPNVRLHDFRAVKSITHDLANYADVIHHSPAIDLEVISFLANGDHVVTRDAPMQVLKQLEAQVAAYQP
jgi:hypothetical protein